MILSLSSSLHLERKSIDVANYKFSLRRRTRTYRWEAWRSESEEVFFSYEYIYMVVPFVQAPERFLIGSLSTWLLVAESLSPRLFNWPAYRLFRDK